MKGFVFECNMSTYPNTVDLLESRLSCNCKNVKEELDSTVRREVWKLFFNMFSSIYGERLTEENLESVEEKMKNDLTWEFMPFDGHDVTGGGFNVIEFSINITNPKMNPFPIWIHDVPPASAPLHEQLRVRLHESIHWDGKFRIDGKINGMPIKQFMKVSLVVRDYHLNDTEDAMEFFDDSSLEY